jgi:hypothetical protein
LADIGTPVIVTREALAARAPPPIDVAVKFEPTSIRFVPSEEKSFLSVRLSASSPVLIYCVFEELVVFGVRPLVLVLLIRNVLLAIWLP